MSFKYVGARLGQALFVLWATFTLSFLLLQVMPSDAILIKYMESSAAIGLERIEEIRHAYGTDRSLHERYVDTIIRFVSGDFGFSIHTDVAVSQEILQALPVTMRLAALSLLCAVVVSVILAVLATLGGVPLLRELIMGIPGFFVALPVFWLAITLIQLFSFKLGWVSVVAPSPIERLVLPVIALTIPTSAPLTQILIVTIERVRSQPFVQVARAKGGSELWILKAHIARNAAISVITIAGLLFGELVAGTVVTETVFGLNGLGRLTYQTVHNQDAPVLQAIVVISAAAFVSINLIIDLIVPGLDPRLRQSMSMRGGAR